MVLDERPHDSYLVGLRRHHQRGLFARGQPESASPAGASAALCLIGAGIGIRALIEERLGQFEAPGLRGGMQGCDASSIGHVGVGATGQQRKR